MPNNNQVLILFFIGAIAITILVSQLQAVMGSIQNNNFANYTIDDKEVVGCNSMELTNCGVVLKKCVNNVSYYCLSKVRKNG